MRIDRCSSPRPGDLEGVGVGGILDPQRDIGAQFAHQPFADVAAGDVFPLPAGKGGGVDHEVHRQGRLVDGDVGERYRIVGGGDGFADADFVEAGDGDDVAGDRLLESRPA